MKKLKRSTVSKKLHCKQEASNCKQKSCIQSKIVIFGETTCFQERKKYIPPPWWRPSFFSFSGSEAPWCIPFFPDLWCRPFSLVLPGKWYTPFVFFCSVTSESGDRPRGSHGGGVYSFFPCVLGRGQKHRFPKALFPEKRALLFLSSDLALQERMLKIRHFLPIFAYF